MDEYPGGDAGERTPVNGKVEMKIKVKYIGKDMAEIRNGEIYDADEVKDDSRYYGVIDRSGESYAYPKTLFEVIEG